MKLNVCHLYPDLLNLYGDRGNIIALKQRCLWRGIECEIIPISLRQPFDADDYDLVFLGGGQDYEQNLLQKDFLIDKGESVRTAIEEGLVFLCVCGGFQLMGQYYEETDGRRIDCLGALDLYTVSERKRLIGDSVSYSSMLGERGFDPVLVGFENHAGRTFLGTGVRPLAKVSRGGGNNGQDGTEGAIYKNVYCTYYHGSFLPKNPDMTDMLIYSALKRKHEALETLTPLAANMEKNARDYIITCK